MTVLDQLRDRIDNYTYDAFGNLLDSAGNTARQGPLRGPFEPGMLDQAARTADPTDSPKPS